MNKLKERRIRYIALIVILGFAASFLYHAYYQGFVLHKGYPYNTFLFRPEARFSDFFQIIRQSREISYLPFVNILIYLFELLGVQTSFFIFAASSIILLFLINRRELLYSLITFLSYPVLFALDRGNIEILVFFLLYFFLDFFRRRKNFLSALFLAGAISIKLFPAVFLILFLAERKFREIFYTLGLVLVFNLAALLTFKEGIISRLQVQMENIRNYGNVYQLGDLGLPFGHSLWGLIKEIVYNLKGYSQSAPVIRDLYGIYPYIAGFILTFFSLYIIFKEKELWKKVLLLVISMDLLPFVSPDYKLLHFFLPLFLFVNSKKERREILYVVLFALLLIPKSYLQGKTTDISIAVILNPLIMMVLAGLVIISGIKHKRTLSGVL